MDRISRQRGVKRGSDGLSASTQKGRLDPSSSSTSSDILVATAPPVLSPQRRTTRRPSIAAKVVNGRLVITGVADLLRRLQAADVNDANVLDDENGPNHKGTYSKAFTLRHPEIKWIHRGQGRYLPTTKLVTPSISVVTSATPQRRAAVSSQSLPVTLSLRRRSDLESEPTKAVDFPKLVKQSSSRAHESASAAYSLRARQPQHEELTASERRSARSSRRSQPVASVEHDYSEDDGEDENDASDERESDDDDDGGTVTFTRDYVNAHPEITWRHCGNGFYKKGDRVNAAHVTAATSLPTLRRSSARSLQKIEALTTAPIDHSRRYHTTELKDYPNVKFSHCGNGWYRVVASESATKMDQTDDHQADGSPSIEGFFSKEDMVLYKNRHPDAEFDNLGGGRWVLLETSPVFEETPKMPKYQSRTTYDKAYVDAHPDVIFHHAGSGRYRRGPRPPPSPPVDQSSNDEGYDVPRGLVDKDFVDAHPDQEFHHRGQGRYAFGPRPPFMPKPLPTPTPGQSTAQTSASDSDLVDTNYVNARPAENFYHKGQGRWARGLPPAGASNKTAVRGPAASSVKLSLTPAAPSVRRASSAKSEIPIPDDAPGFDELLIRSEGPERWPELDWVYRGGGKWARKAATKLRKGSARSKKTIVEDDSDDNEDGYLKAEPGRRKLGARKTSSLLDARSTSQISEGRLLEEATIPGRTSKSTSSKSKTATPRLAPLTVEEDPIDDPINYPSLYAESWSDIDHNEDGDEAAALMRALYQPLNSAEAFIEALTRHDSSIRPKATLQAVTAHAQEALRLLQNEYLELDKITAPHARIPRRPAKGGRLPVDSEIFEDRKEADLYDYSFDARKIGYQDPDTQRIVRDAEGRELRKRRQRGGLDTDPFNAAPIGGEDTVLSSRRVPKPVNRFDQTASAPTRRRRAPNGITHSPVRMNGSMTPDLGVAPTLTFDSNGNFMPPATGRWAGHVPKRIQELRGDSQTTLASNEAEGSVDIGEPMALDDATDVRVAPKPKLTRRKRKDAGIPKGPKKGKVVNSIEGSRIPDLSQSNDWLGTLSGFYPQAFGIGEPMEL
ncbi:hypothetical protein LTR95_013789 [Oleoguttula sp. CCFEE 5521]